MSLKHGIFGLLSYNEMSGYDLMKYFKESINFFWTAQTSQIYRELDKLKKDEFIEAKEIIQEKRPNKKLFKAGIELIKYNKFSSDTIKLLNEPLIEVKKFVAMANESWHAGSGVKNISEAHKFMRLMALSMNEESSKGVEKVFEFRFNDSNESFYLKISNCKCEVFKEIDNKPDIRIITTFQTWKDISENKISGPQAMMEGLFKIEGDFQLFMKFTELFKTKSTERKGVRENKILGIDGQKWMAIGFISWNLSWIFIKFNIILGVIVPFLLSLGIIIKKRETNYITYFDKLTFFYFSQLTVISLFNRQLVSKEGLVLNYVAIGLIWLSSILNPMPLTGEYSKYGFEESMEHNVIFIKTNKIITVFWAAIFFVQGALVICLKNLGLIKYYPLVYVLLFVAGAFTKWFPSWYPAYVARGRKI